MADMSETKICEVLGQLNKSLKKLKFCSAVGSVFALKEIAAENFQLKAGSAKPIGCPVVAILIVYFRSPGSTGPHQLSQVRGNRRQEELRRLVPEVRRGLEEESRLSRMTRLYPMLCQFYKSINTELVKNITRSHKYCQIQYADADLSGISTMNFTNLVNTGL